MVEDEFSLSSVTATACTGKEVWLGLTLNSSILSAMDASCSTEFSSKVGAKIFCNSEGKREKNIFLLSVLYSQLNLWFILLECSKCSNEVCVYVCVCVCDSIRKEEKK